MGDPDTIEFEEPLRQCLVGLFVDSNESLSDPKYWDPLAVYLLLRGIEIVKIDDPQFTGNKNLLCAHSKNGRNTAEGAPRVR